MGIRKQLNETGVAEDEECQYCGFESALHDYESRADLEPTQFQHDGGYRHHYYCPLCGWSEYEEYEGDDEVDDPFVEAEPDDQQVRNSKQIQNLLEKADDVSDVVSEHIYEYIWTQHDPEKDNLSNIEEGIFGFIFSQRR